jgi:putative ABC transport system permease protein
MLTLPKLVARNLAYHWRGNLAVLLGVAVGSAVLTGALLVGDSLRGSLRARVERQLGGLDAVAILPRPLRASLADDLPGKTAPVLLLPASLQASGDPANAPFLGRVTVLGVDRRFQPTDAGIDWNGTAKQIVLSARVAQKLGAKVGDKVKLGVERFSDFPRSSSLAKRAASDVTATEEFAVAAVLPADAPGNDFNLLPNPAAPLNVFVPIRTLSRMATGDADPVATALLSSGASVDDLNKTLKATLQPEDYGLKFREIDRLGYLSVESDLLILPPDTVTAIEATAKALGFRAEPTVVYVVDTLAHEKREIPYPIVAGLNASAAKPLGPFLPKDVPELGNGEVILLNWPRSELNGLPVGSKIRVAYFDPDVEGEGKLKPAELTLRGYIPLAGAARDKDLTPEIRGVTDVKADLSNWDRPPVLPKEKIRERVPEKPVRHPRSVFFDTNKATPMAYVNLATARELFKSRYGSDTSVRVAGPEGMTPEAVKDRLRPPLLERLDAKAAGLAFDDVRKRLLDASGGGTDFGGLFLGFSFFLIAAALMLVGLLFRLTLDRRAKEVGLLLATGYSVRQVRRLLLLEGLALAVLGAVIGLALGIGYNRLLLAVLLDLWPDREVANVLRPHATAMSFALGFGLTVLMSLGALWLSIRGLVKVPPPALLRGETEVPATVAALHPGRWARRIALVALPLGIALIVAGKFVANPDMQAGSFFGGGGLLLTAGLAAAWLWMKRTRHALVNGRGAGALARLGSRNAARNPGRSLLTAALLASAAFLLVAVESFRRQPGTEFLDKQGGSGGFNLIAETDLPLFESFGAGPGRRDLEAQVKAVHGDPATLDYLEEVFALRLRPGDDASCMNLFQATRPRVLGVPDSLVARGGFKFYATEAKTPEQKANPWLLLNEPAPEGAIPVFCEQNTAQWMLKTAVGGEIEIPPDMKLPADVRDPNDRTKDVKFRIVGTFADSPFQSELLMADKHFLRRAPNHSGYRVFLIRTPAGKEEAVARVLSVGLRANGLIATPTRERVAAYQAVIGAYLSTFQLLGGLGLLLGVLGLAVVVLRGVWERVGELALLRAVGFRTRQLQFLVLAENALLLVAGLAIGLVAALVSVAPHVAEGAAVPWVRLGAILALVLVVGLGVASAATAGILRVPVIPALRRE